MCLCALPDVFLAKRNMFWNNNFVLKGFLLLFYPLPPAARYISYSHIKNEYNVGHYVHIQGYARKSVLLRESSLRENCLRGKCIQLLFLSVSIK